MGGMHLKAGRILESPPPHNVICGDKFLQNLCGSTVVIERTSTGQKQ
jgi:hypothetical protein